MPKPPAAFSPLTTTQSSFQSATSRGSRSMTMARPLRPTTSPTNNSRIGRWLADTPYALGERLAEAPGTHHERSAAPDHDRQGELRPPVGQPAHQGQWIDLAPDRRKARHKHARSDLERELTARNRFRRRLTQIGRQRVPARQSFAPECGLGVDEAYIGHPIG